MINDTDGLPQEPGFISRATYSAMCKSQRETQRRLDQAERERGELREALADHKAAIREYFEARDRYESTHLVSEHDALDAIHQAAEARLRGLEERKGKDG